MYRPIRNFPPSKSAAVKMAPSHTSRHWMGVSGSHLNIIANSRLITAKDARKPAICNVASGRYGATYFPAAERAAVSSMDTNSRKPSESTPASDQIYVRAKRQIPDPGGVFTSHAV